MSVASIGVLRLAQSTIGKKVIMAITGLIWVGFVANHMYGNLKVFFGPEEFGEYAVALREFGAPFFSHSEILWGARIVLLVALLLHIWAFLTLTRESRRARSTSYAKHSKIRTNLAALYMRVGGVVLLIFIIFHLAHFTFGVPGIHPNFIWDEREAYHNLVTGFQSYAFVPAFLYIIVMVFLGSHLYHGTWSVFQTLGLNNKDYTKPLRLVAILVAVGIAGGFAIVPLAVILGIVN